MIIQYSVINVNKYFYIFAYNFKFIEKTPKPYGFSVFFNTFGFGTRFPVNLR